MRLAARSSHVNEEIPGDFSGATAAALAATGTGVGAGAAIVAAGGATTGSVMARVSPE